MAATMLEPCAVTGRAPWVRIVRETRAVEETLGRRVRVASVQAAVDALASLRAEEVEVFVVVCLDAQHNMIARSEVTRGILDGSMVHPREVFRLAIALGAASIIIAHNHPSGNVVPSPEDRLVTRQMREAGKLLDIPVHDHIIVGGHNQYYSFAECGEL